MSRFDIAHEVILERRLDSQVRIVKERPQEHSVSMTFPSTECVEHILWAHALADPASHITEGGHHLNFFVQQIDECLRRRCYRRAPSARGHVASSIYDKAVLFLHTPLGWNAYGYLPGRPIHEAVRKSGCFVTHDRALTRV